VADLKKLGPIYFGANFCWDLIAGTSSPKPNKRGCMQVVGLLIQIEGIQSAIMAVYRSPHFEERRFYATVLDIICEANKCQLKNLVVVGYFNIDYADNS